mmetsp:Transcript_3940/g.6657  ORF Transcript_3940/g.6657 Transcript_3940/m.6657 type:complete len:308 (-) Transcript_3940:137-1060(-)
MRCSDSASKASRMQQAEATAKCTSRSRRCSADECAARSSWCKLLTRSTRCSRAAVSLWMKSGESIMTRRSLACVRVGSGAFTSTSSCPTRCWSESEYWWCCARLFLMVEMHRLTDTDCELFPESKPANGVCVCVFVWEAEASASSGFERFSSPCSESAPMPASERLGSDGSRAGDCCRGASWCWPWPPASETSERDPALSTPRWCRRCSPWRRKDSFSAGLWLSHTWYMWFNIRASSLLSGGRVPCSRHCCEEARWRKNSMHFCPPVSTNLRISLLRFFLFFFLFLFVICVLNRRVMLHCSVNQISF